MSVADLIALIAVAHFAVGQEARIRALGTGILRREVLFGESEPRHCLAARAARLLQLGAKVGQRLGRKQLRLRKFDLALFDGALCLGKLLVFLRRGDRLFRLCDGAPAKGGIVALAFGACVCGDRCLRLIFRELLGRGLRAGFFGDRRNGKDAFALPFGEQLVHIGQGGGGARAPLGGL